MIIRKTVKAYKKKKQTVSKWEYTFDNLATIFFSNLGARSRWAILRPIAVKKEQVIR